MTHRERLKRKKRIIIKLGTTTITHSKTGGLNLFKLEKLVRLVCDLRSQGKDVVLVSSGAIAVGRKALGLKKKPKELAMKQACAAVGQAKLMMVYQKLFSEYNQVPAQVLMTKYTIVDDVSRQNAQNTFRELLNMGVVPIVNENDTVATDEIEYVQTFGENDALSAIVSALVEGDLLILMSDIDGLYTDDPKINSEARFIGLVEGVDGGLMDMAKGSSSQYGTGGMETKLKAAKIANAAGADMVIVNGKNVEVIQEVLAGAEQGTLFVSHGEPGADVFEYLKNNTDFMYG